MMPEAELTANELAKRRVPGVIAYLHPFRIVETKQSSPWSASIDQINQRDWDYAALHEVVGGIDVGLPAPLHMVVGRDGAIVLPRTKGLETDQEIVEFFNKCLGAILLGGIYCEAITPDAIDLGSIIDWKYVRSVRSGTATPNRFHALVRLRMAAPVEAIALHKPRSVFLEKLQGALADGLRILNQLPEVRGEYLLKGTTGFARRDWGTCLANLWIVIEQILSHLWKIEVLAPTCSQDSSKSRRDQLSDTRTWTAAARIELLFQKGLISNKTVADLSTARRARNELAHNGKHPTEADAKACYSAVEGLIKVALPAVPVALFNLDLMNHSISDPFNTPARMGDPTHWMPIPKLPGEEELERAEAAARRSRLQVTEE